MWLLHVSVLVCSGWPGSKMPPWKQALWRWAALEGFLSQRSSRTPTILENCQSGSKVIFPSTTTTSLWPRSSRWNCSPVAQAEQTDSRNESSSKFSGAMVFMNRIIIIRLFRVICCDRHQQRSEDNMIQQTMIMWSWQQYCTSETMMSLLNEYVNVWSGYPMNKFPNTAEVV